jgi:EpsI family protein
MSNKRFIICFFTIVTTIIWVTGIASRGNWVVVKTNLENLPMEISGYKATEESFSDSVYEELNADQHVYRHYSSSDGEKINLYIGYYGTAKGGRTGHNPYGCLPGSGWGIIDSHGVTLKTKTHCDGVDVNYILAKKGSLYEILLFWYQSLGDRIISNGIQQNLFRFVGSVSNNRTDGVFVQVSALCRKSSIQETIFKTTSFAEKVIEILPHYWPVEQQVTIPQPLLP